MDPIKKFLLGSTVFAMGLEFASQFYKTNLHLTYKETKENQNTINNCFSLVMVYSLQ